MADNLVTPWGTVATEDLGGVPAVHAQRVKIAGGGDGQAVDVPVTTAHGVQTDERGVDTTVITVAAAAGAVVAAAAKADRRLIRIYFDGPTDALVYIREGGAAGAITATNWSFPLAGGKMFSPTRPSLGAYQAWWANQGAPAGSLRVTEG